MIKNWGSSCSKNFSRISKFCTFEKTISFTCLHDTCTWLVGIFRIIVQPFNSERKCLKYNIMMNILTSLLLIKNWEKTQTQIKTLLKDEYRWHWMELMYEQINNYCKNKQMNTKNSIMTDQEMKLKEKKIKGNMNF